MILSWEYVYSHYSTLLPTMSVATLLGNALAAEIPEEVYSLTDIVTKRDVYDKYIQDINTHIKKNKPVCLTELISFVGTRCPDLKPFHDLTNFDGKSLNKGIMGQIIEQTLFGNKPNCISEADLHALGIELKILPMKLLKQTKKYSHDRINTKERTKLSYAGCERTPTTFNDITDAQIFQDTKCYKKSKHISYIGYMSPQKKWKTLNELLNNKILFITTVSLESLPTELKEEIKDDFVKIQTSIAEKKYTQRGQKSIHCHRCGSKGSTKRALGFTPKFTLKMIAHSMGIDIEQKGRSSWIRVDSL